MYNKATKAQMESRLADHPSVSSGDRGRPIADLIERFEQVDPQAVAKAGFSSAALRAADWVRNIRKTAGLSQQELASRVGVSQARVSEIEQGAGSQGPTIGLLDRIAKACGREINFFDEQVQPPEPRLRAARK